MVVDDKEDLSGNSRNALVERRDSDWEISTITRSDQRLQTQLAYLHELDRSLTERRQRHDEYMETLQRRKKELDQARSKWFGQALALLEKEKRTMARSRWNLEAADKAREEHGMRYNKFMRMRWAHRALIHRRELMKNRVTRYERLRDYVERAITASEQFPNVDAMIKRHHSLVLTLRGQRMKNRELQSTIRDLKHISQAVEAASKCEYLTLEGQMGKLTLRLDEVMLERASWQAELSQLSSLERKRMSEITTIMQTIGDLYMSTRHNELKASVLENPEEQLVYIKHYVEHLKSKIRWMKRKDA